MEYLTLFTAFILKHFIADFPLQSQRMVDEKGTYGKEGGIIHAGIHGWFTMLIITLFYVTTGWDITAASIIGALCGLLDMIIHYHVDWAKMRLGRGLTPQDRCFWTLLGVDQMLHYLTYVLIIGLVL
jgi:hypothetical protein